MRKIDHHHCSGPGAQCDICGPDPRDAEIAALKAEVERLKRALAAGPAALRIDARDGEPWGPYKQLPVEEAVATVEAAQAAAMKEGT